MLLFGCSISGTVTASTLAATAKNRSAKDRTAASASRLGRCGPPRSSAVLDGKHLSDGACDAKEQATEALIRR